jgi:hypothetical protein
LNQQFKLKILFLVSLVFSTSTLAEGWCSYLAGEFQVITHGTKTDNVYLLGKFVGTTAQKYIIIANSTAGKNNLSLALAAQMSGKGLSVYIDSAEFTCESYANWSTSPLRHVKIVM